MGIADWEGVETENMEGSAHNRTYGGTKRYESTCKHHSDKGEILTRRPRLALVLSDDLS